VYFHGSLSLLGSLIDWLVLLLLRLLFHLRRFFSTSKDVAWSLIGVSTLLLRLLNWLIVSSKDVVMCWGLLMDLRKYVHKECYMCVCVVEKNILKHTLTEVLAYWAGSMLLVPNWMLEVPPGCWLTLQNVCKVGWC